MIQTHPAILFINRPEIRILFIFAPGLSIVPLLNNIRAIYIGLTCLLTGSVILGQEHNRPSIAAFPATGHIRVDGSMDETDWSRADSITALGMVEPEEKAEPSFPTHIRVLITAKDIYLGITCFDPEPDDIVAFSKARDSELEDEDYIKVVLDTYQDGRNGYIFAVNPFGARYDALVSNNGESENPNWDGAWEAATRIGEDRWSAEIRIPVSTLTYNRSLDAWGFNVERRIQRLLEVDRWSGVSMDYTIGRTRHAGQLNGLEGFHPGIGLIPAVSLVGKRTREGTGVPESGLKPSLDITQRVTTDITAQLTVNTDFAETEVDSRQTNLTRFPVLYPEKRQFFLEGADIYDFGLSLGRSLMPFYSRRIGLYEGEEVPILLGGKVSGKVRNTHFGGLFTHTREVGSPVPATNMGVIRLRQNIFKESTIGMIATMGEPGGTPGAYTTGIDFTYQTSTMGAGKNFLVGAWAMFNDREGLSGDRTAAGIKIDYPNDLWDWFLQYRRIGNAFDPAMGFVPRKAISSYEAKVDFMPRPGRGFIRQHSFRLLPSLFTDPGNHWESFDISLIPFAPQLESGDRFEAAISTQGEYLKVPFEISEGVSIDPGGYHWFRYHLEATSASKRRINGSAAYSFGGFYGGRLDQVELLLNWRVISLLILEFMYENNVARIPAGNFNKELFATRAAVNISSDLNLSLFVQYDNESRNVGTYSRLRWTFAPRGDLFVVFKHNIQPALEDRWVQDQNQLILKLTYGIAI